MKNIPWKNLIIIFVFFILSSCGVSADESFNVPEDDMFAPVELDLTDYSYMNKQNKKFKLSAEKEASPSYTQSKGQVWDENMLFRYNYYSDESNLRVLPSYGSLGSYVTTKLDENTSLMVGQDALTEMNGDTLSFSYPNYSYYSSGARITGEHEKMHYSVGAFTETDTLHQQLAAVVTTKPTHIKGSEGTFYVGGGVFTNLMDDVNKTSSGVMAHYRNKKFSAGAQLSHLSYSKAGYNESNSAHFLTSYRINEHWLLKNRIVKNFDFDEVQGELEVVYNPLKDSDRLQLKVSAANWQSQSVATRQRLKFTTSFKF